MKLEEALKEIKKKFGDDSIGTVPEMKVEIEKITSGSPYINYALNGGFPLGKLIELYGPYSSGKSLIAYRTIAEAQKRGKSCILFDVENSFDPNFAQKLGIDVNKLIICKDSLGETMFDKLVVLLQSDPEVIVVDSIAALVPQSELEDSMEQQTMGLHARLMSKALRKVNAVNKKTALIFINQLREKIGSYGNPETVTGGRALGFYASIRLEIRRGEFILANKEKIGQEIKFKVTKSKIGYPFKSGILKFDYGTCSFDSADELISVGIITDKIKRRGAYYDIFGETFQGKDQLVEKLIKEKDFSDKIYKEIMSK